MNNLDDLSVQISEGIISLVTNKDFGNHSLPEDFDGEPYYTVYDYDFSIDLDIKIDKKLSDYFVDFEYYRDTDEIYIILIIPKNIDESKLSDLYYDLVEGVRHELEHVKQNSEGYEFGDEPTDHEEYYLQDHEIKALRAGFNNRSRIENKNYEDVVRSWFNKNRNKFNLSDGQIDSIVGQIIG